MRCGDRSACLFGIPVMSVKRTSFDCEAIMPVNLRYRLICRAYLWLFGRTSYRCSEFADSDGTVKEV